MIPVKALLIVLWIVPTILASCYRPLELSSRRMEAGVTVANDKIYFAGGREGSTDSYLVDIYDTKTNSWSTITLPERRKQIAAITLGSHVLFAGGGDGGFFRYNKIDVYNTETQQMWTLALNTTFNLFKYVVVGSKAYIYGNNAQINEIHIVDLEANSTTKIPLNFQLLSAATNGTHIFFLQNTRMAVRIFDTETREWSNLRLVQATFTTTQVFMVGNSLVFVGEYRIAVVWLTSLEHTRELTYTDSRAIGFVQSGNILYLAGASTLSVYSETSIHQYKLDQVFFHSVWQSVIHDGIIYFTGSTIQLAIEPVLTVDTNSLFRSIDYRYLTDIGRIIAENGFLFTFLSNSPKIIYQKLPDGESREFNLPNGRLNVQSNGFIRVDRLLVAVGDVAGQYCVFNFDTETWITGFLPFAIRTYQPPTTNGKIAAFVDITGAALYNTTSNTWHQIAKAGQFKVFVENTLVWVGLREIEFYNTITHEWSRIELELSRWRAAAYVVRGSLFFLAGGQNEQEEDLDTVYIIDVATGTLETRHLSLARWSMSATTVGDYVVFAGGAARTGDRAVSQRVDIYNVKEDSWRWFDLSAVPSPLAVPRLDLAAFQDTIYFARQNRIEKLNLTSGAVQITFIPYGIPRYDWTPVVIGSKIIFLSNIGNSPTITIYETSSNQVPTVTLWVDSQHIAQLRLTTTENYLVLPFSSRMLLLELATMYTSINDAELFIGQSINFTVDAVGRRLRTHWEHNLVRMVHENQMTLSLNNVTEQFEGTYSLNIVDQCSQRMRQEATLTVHGRPAFTELLEESIALCHETATLQTEVTGKQVSYEWRIGNINFPTTSTPRMEIDGQGLECNTAHSFCVTAVNPSGAQTSCSTLRLVSHDAVFDGPRPTVDQPTWFSDTTATLTVRLLDEDCTEHHWLVNGLVMGVNGSQSSTVDVQISPLTSTQSFSVVAVCGNSVLTSHPFRFEGVSSLHVWVLVLVIVGPVVVLAGLTAAAFMVRKRMIAGQEHEVELQNLLTEAKSDTLKKDGVSIIQATRWEWKPTDDFTYRPLDKNAFVVDSSPLNSAFKEAITVGVWTQGLIHFTMRSNSKKSKNDKKLKERLLSGSQIDIHVPKSPKYEIKVEPSSFTVEEGVTIQITVSVLMRMTAKSTICLVVVCEQDKVYSFSEFKITSAMSTWIDLDEVETTGDYLGGGGFGEVTRGVYRGEDVAIKKLLSQHLTDDLKIEFEREIMLMKDLRHPNIVQFVGASNVKDKLAIVIEFAPLGSLASVMKKHSLSLFMKLSMLFEIAKALQFLHTNGVIHRDIKPQNILVFSLEPKSPVHVKLTDFGTARFIADDPTTITKNIGTISYMAPEALGKAPKIDKSADVYSFAVLMWEVLFEQTPFSDYKWDSDIELHVKSGNRLPFPHGHDYSPTLINVIEDCWRHAPEERPSMGVVVQRLSALNV